MSKPSPTTPKPPAERKRREIVLIDLPKLKLAMYERAMDQAQLLKDASVSKSSLQRGLTGDGISWNKLLDIAHALNWNAADLVKQASDDGAGTEGKHTEQFDAFTILPVEHSNSTEFEQAMCLMDDRFGSEILTHMQFGAMIDRPIDRWFSNLIVAKDGGGVSATLQLNYDKQQKRGYLSYAARAGGDPRRNRYRWALALADHVTKMMLSGGLSDCELLCLELENDPRVTDEQVARKQTLALLRLYGQVVSRVVRNRWGFRIVDVAGYFIPHQTYRRDSSVGDEWSGVLAVIMHNPQASMAQSELSRVVQWLWEDLYVYRYGEAGANPEIYAAYMDNCVKQMVKTLPASAPLLRYEEFHAAVRPADNRAKISVAAPKVGGLI